ncbi:hypothetical protein ABZ570_04245 [Micromonospora sp. NPDC007271]|uniref:hypothetical protein n=1 Tax=Micromonospora sp. NPDC007271 TaxID=3154587 RepID=UPI0034065445
MSQPARPGRGKATVGAVAHAGGWFGRSGPVAVVVAAGFFLRYDHSAAFLRRMNPNIAHLPGVRGSPRPGE